MSFSLEITFGGLCLFVQRNDSVKGLFVLMPDYMRHLPMLVYDGKYTPGGSAGEHVVPIRGQSISFAGLYTGTRKLQDMPQKVARVSEIAEGRRVADHWANDPALVNPLAARIEMDLGLAVTVEDTTNTAYEGVVKARYKKKGEILPASHEHTVVGLAKVIIPNVESLPPIMGQTFKDQGGKVELGFLNIEPRHLNQPKPEPHEKNEVLDHFSAYYTLMADCPPECGGPTLRVAKDLNLQLGPLRRTYIDPLTCILGTGCSENEEKC